MSSHDHPHVLEPFRLAYEDIRPPRPQIRKWPEHRWMDRGSALGRWAYALVAANSRALVMRVLPMRSYIRRQGSLVSYDFVPPMSVLRRNGR